MISGVVILYFPDKNIIQNINSYIAPLDALYIFDNSPTKSIFVEKYFSSESKVVFINNFENKGISECLNIAAKKSRDFGSKWLLTMDQDSIFEGNKFNSFLEIIKSNMIDVKKTAVLSPNHITSLNSKDRGEGLYKVLITMTSGNLINLDIHSKIGGFDEGLFIDAVDWDYCLKADLNLYDVIQSSEHRLVHNLGIVTRHKLFGIYVTCQNYNKYRRYYITRNKLVIFRRYIFRYPRLCFRWLFTIFVDFIKIIAFEDEKMNKTKLMILGMLDFFKGFKGSKW